LIRLGFNKGYKLKYIVTVLLVLVMGLGCSSLRVSVDYDPEFDFDAAHNFIVVHHNKMGEDTLFNDRLIEALDTELRLKGYSKGAKQDTDLVFVFHTNVESKTDIDTDYTMVGYGRYGYGGGMVATTRTRTYNKGTLIIDAMNPKDMKIVWRGVATDILKTHDNPKERKAYINKVVKETMQSFPTKF